MVFASCAFCPHCGRWSKQWCSKCSGNCDPEVPWLMRSCALLQQTRPDDDSHKRRKGQRIEVSVTPDRIAALQSGESEAARLARQSSYDSRPPKRPLCPVSICTPNCVQGGTALVPNNKKAATIRASWWQSGVEEKLPACLMELNSMYRAYIVKHEYL